MNAPKEQPGTNWIDFFICFCELKQPSVKQTMHTCNTLAPQTCKTINLHQAVQC